MNIISKLLNIQDGNVKVAIILGASLIISTALYSILNAHFNKSDLVRCVEARLDYANTGRIATLEKIPYIAFQRCAELNKLKVSLSSDPLSLYIDN